MATMALIPAGNSLKERNHTSQPDLHTVVSDEGIQSFLENMGKSEYVPILEQKY